MDHLNLGENPIHNEHYLPQNIDSVKEFLLQVKQRNDSTIYYNKLGQQRAQEIIRTMLEGREWYPYESEEKILPNLKV